LRCRLDTSRLRRTHRAATGWRPGHRGRAGYEKYRHDFSKQICQLASPKWNFDDATYDRTASAFHNPDHVAIMIHNCRWRQDLAGGEAGYDELENRAHHHHGRRRQRRSAPLLRQDVLRQIFASNIEDGIGHNLPQEAPRAFAEAVVGVTALN
jgi:hypothetical protein